MQGQFHLYTIILRIIWTILKILEILEERLRGKEAVLEAHRGKHTLPQLIGFFLVHPIYY